MGGLKNVKLGLLSEVRRGGSEGFPWAQPCYMVDISID